LESLHQYFSKEQLPVSFGGDIEDNQAAERRGIDELLEQNMPLEGYFYN